MNKLKVIACVIVRTDRVFSWLGHMPILNWATTQLIEARGIDSIVCLCPSKLLERAKKLLNDECVDTVVLPKEVLNMTQQQVENWLVSKAGPANLADVVVYSNASTPFLPSAKIEQCIGAVRRGKYAVAHAVRETSIVLTDKVASVKENVTGIKVWRTGASEPKIHTVPVGMIESLSVEIYDSFVIANSLVSSGAI